MSSFTPTGGGGGLPTTTVSGTLGTVKSMYSEVLSIGANDSTTILQYTVPGATVGYVLSIEISGSNIAIYDVLLNGIQWARYRTYFGGPFVVITKLGTGLQDAVQLQSGDILTINVQNFRPMIGDFEARLQYIEV